MSKPLEPSEAFVRCARELIALVGDRVEIPRSEMRGRFTELDEQVYRLAARLNLLQMLPESGWLCRPMECAELPPPQLVGFTKLPGDWNEKTDSFEPIADLGWRRALEFMCDAAEQPAPAVGDPVRSVPPPTPVTPEPSMPWEDGQGWARPESKQARLILKVMFGRDSVPWERLATEVWGTTEVRENTVNTALSRVNAYLVNQPDSRKQLHKERDEDVIRWT